MANHPSALKRARQNEEKRTRNRIVKTKVKNIVKTLRAAVGQSSDPEAVAKHLNQAKSVIAKSAKKGVIHKKTASRKISRLSKIANSSRKS
ncbi:MAG: 30S ribosomal protein S20 [Deltaproteobacteria bacterium RBG_13_49_15]|nr:MAG: 30S ribosomal protein S20 [Deltaproteobacteria bacterium RBG_13_49_15]